MRDSHYDRMRRRAEPAALPRATVDASAVRAPDGIDEIDPSLPIVSVSDVHGYLSEVRSALTAVGDADRFDPVVTAGDDGRLHWAGNDYLLLFNGDLIDRGDRNAETIELVVRLAEEAPPGRVRYHLGNHEMAMLLPEVLFWPGTYSARLERDARERFAEWITAGLVTAALEGHDHTYSHAGSQTGVDAAAANAELRAAAEALRAASADGECETVQSEVPDRFPTVFGLGGASGRGPDAGLLWMDFSHMPAGAPAQIVGHTRQATPTRRGETVCGNVLRWHQGSPGGEGVLVETRDELVSVTRTREGGAVVEDV
jgi:hypothetical protein